VTQPTRRQRIRLVEDTRVLRPADERHWRIALEPARYLEHEVVQIGRRWFGPAGERRRRDDAVLDALLLYEWRPRPGRPMRDVTRETAEDWLRRGMPGPSAPPLFVPLCWYGTGHPEDGDACYVCECTDLLRDRRIRWRR
jgi:hypothetical protein